MRGTYKHAKAAGGVCHYADVAVELFDDESEISASSLDLYADDPSWIMAAENGLEDAIRLIDDRNWRVGRISKIEGNIADTTADAAWLAAFVAALDALEQVDRVGELRFEEGSWVVSIGESHAKSRPT